jgi:hypothetical protein
VVGVHEETRPMLKTNPVVNKNDFLNVFMFLVF